ncbi:MAG: YkgJ family cysteine cluster protein [Desulfobacterales bacterium]
MRDLLIPIAADTVFRFECSPKVACFNQCCRDLVQALTPYDVLRIRQGLGLPSGRFLEQFTRRHTGPDSGLPVVTLKPADEKTRVCPFVSPSGCRIYPHRPASCRSYPLVRSLGRSRATGVARESFYILREPHCRGFETARQQTVRGWIEGQDLAGYNAENDRMLDLIHLKNRLHPGPLPADTIAALTMALYDLDAFRAQLLHGRIPAAEALQEAFPSAVEGDDLQLLQAGLAWAKRILER